MSGRDLEDAFFGTAEAHALPRPFAAGGARGTSKEQQARSKAADKSVFSFMTSFTPCSGTSFTLPRERSAREATKRCLGRQWIDSNNEWSLWLQPAGKKHLSSSCVRSSGSRVPPAICGSSGIGSEA